MKTETCAKCEFEKEKHRKKDLRCQSYDMGYGETILLNTKFTPQNKGCRKDFDKEIRGRIYNVTCGNYFSGVDEMLLCFWCQIKKGQSSISDKCPLKVGSLADGLKRGTFNLSKKMVSQIWIEEIIKGLKKPYKEHFCKGEEVFKDICTECQENKGLRFFYPVEDVKTFIEMIDITMLVTPSPMEKGEFIIWLHNEIKKLAGENNGS